MATWLGFPLLWVAPMIAPASSPTVDRLVEWTLLPVELNIVEKTNAQRVERGLKPLRIDLALMKSARRHATWMTNNQSLVHTSAGVGENIAWNQHDSSEAVQDWMNSDGHRANILDPSYTRIGAAAYIARDGSIYWCEQFQR